MVLLGATALITRAITSALWGQESIYLEWSFIYSISFRFRFLFLIDQIRITFWFTVILIRISVYIFRASYIVREKNFVRFHIILRVFVVRIVLLIARPRLVSALLGWDGLGLSSYLLVIYYSNSKSYNSGIITALTNRIGDRLLLLMIGFRFLELGCNIYYLGESEISKLSMWALTLAAFTKRAQIPFSSWLPAAIAAPTPVSSLVHSSTLVTAGVYLLVRFNYYFYDYNNLVYLGIVGSLTTFLARTAAIIEIDLKKMVALSTLRQLGIIVSLLGLGVAKIAFIHLIAHAFFKALLFLSTGAIIHASRRGQDLRWMGRNAISFSRTKRMAFLANLRLAGVPFISAFYSKEIYLEEITHDLTWMGVLFLFYTGVLLTAVYSIRFLALYYARTKKSFTLTILREKDWNNFVAMLILRLPAILGGRTFSSFITDRVGPLRANQLYVSLRALVLLVLTLSTSWWSLHLGNFESRLVKLLKSIWGLTILRRKLGSWTFSAPPTLALKLNSGLHSYSLFKLPEILTYPSSLSMLNKQFTTTLLVIRIWLAIMSLYYLNNKITRSAGRMRP